MGEASATTQQQDTTATSSSWRRARNAVRRSWRKHKRGIARRPSVDDGIDPNNNNGRIQQESAPVAEGGKLDAVERGGPMSQENTQGTEEPKSRKRLYLFLGVVITLLVIAVVALAVELAMATSDDDSEETGQDVLPPYQDDASPPPQQGVSDTESAVIDLSGDFDLAPLYNNSTGAKELIDFAASEPEIKGMVVVEHGLIVAEYYDDEPDDNDETTVSFQWCITKSWMGLLFGIMEWEGLISLNETLADVWQDPNNQTWKHVPDAEARKDITIESLLTLSSGLSQTTNYWMSCANPFDGGRCGGKDLIDALGYDNFDPAQTGTWEYLSPGNLLSYVVKERTGMNPEEYASEKVFPYLGITSEDYFWMSNSDDIPYSFHGLRMTVRGMAKLGLLYLQGGLASKDKRIVSKSWIDRSTTTQVRVVDGRIVGFGYSYLWWIFSDSVEYCALGMGDQGICVDAPHDRIIAITSDNYLPPFGGGEYKASREMLRAIAKTCRFDV